MSSLAQRLNLNRYDPSDLRDVFKCTKCSVRLRDSSSKKCDRCKLNQSQYMKRYRDTQQQSEVATRLEKSIVKKVDNDFEVFMKHVESNNERDVLKLVLCLQVQDFIMNKDMSLDRKKELLKIHYTSRILAVLQDIGLRFILKSSCVKKGIFYLRYICVRDLKNGRNKRLVESERYRCCSKLSLALDLQANRLKIGFNHKRHQDEEINTSAV